MAKKCGCEEKSSCTCFVPKTVASKQIDAKNIIYHSDNITESRLLNIGIKNGSNLETIVETLNKEVVRDGTEFSLYDYGCFGENYNIEDQESFASSVATELCRLNSLIANLNVLKVQLEQLVNRVDIIETPEIEDNSYIGILETDTINQVLQKLSNNINPSVIKGGTYFINNQSNVSTKIVYYEIDGTLQQLLLGAGQSKEITNVRNIVSNPTSTLIVTYKGNV